MMKTTVFGAAGMVGSRVVAEALDRGHQVTAVVRSPARAAGLPPGAMVRVADVARPETIGGLLSGQDAAISALRPPEGREGDLVALTGAVLDAAAQAGVRVVVVGGAANLKMPDGSGHTVLTAPGFLPQAVVPIARACVAQYRMVEADAAADWSYVSPPAMLTPGRRTGTYRRGSDVLLVDAAGASAISVEDFAVALLDEAEAPRHRRQAFTVAA